MPTTDGERLLEAGVAQLGAQAHTLVLARATWLSLNPTAPAGRLRDA